jgi:hypothetical protein
MTKRAETIGMRVLTVDEVGLVSGGAPTTTQVAGDIASGVAMLALGGVAAAAVCAAEFTGYAVGYAIDHATKKK